jgi:hypothetical protein
MRQIAYPAAFGGCVLGAAAMPSRAAEWSITPTYSSSVNYDSNRILAAHGKGSDAAVLTVDLLFKHALEDLQLTFEPKYTYRRFTDASLGNGDERSITAGMNWTGERASATLTGSYFDQSTLYTEALETGIVTADTHRRLGQAGASWNWNQSERRAMIGQVSYLDVSYYGRFAQIFPGYRYPSASLGEQFAFNEQGTFAVSAFGSRLQSNTQGNSSHELGLQAEVGYLFSERTKVDVSLGKSKRVLTGSNSQGTDASVLLDHSFSLGKLSFNYKRSLVPYGFGFLVEQQQYGVTFTRPLTPYLDCSLTALRIENNETAVLLNLDRRNYNNLSSSVTWHPWETWAVGMFIEGTRTQTVGVHWEPVHQWLASVTLTWSPFPKSRSW